MRGHEKILEMRRNGTRPACVFANDYPCDTDWFQTGEHVTVSVAGDSPERADYRFAIGLTVHVSASTDDRAQRIADAFKRCGAALVAGSSQQGWAEVWRRPQEQDEGEKSHG